MQAALGQDAEFLAESLFRVFDDDKSGSMDFQEYIMALNATRLVFSSNLFFSFLNL